MSSGLMSRREVLAAGVAGGLGVALSACASSSMSSSLRQATSVKPAGSDIGAIKHVIFLMQENRSFDHYFGAYPGVSGFDDHLPGDNGVFAQPWPANTAKPPTGVVLPFHLDTKTTNAECTFDLDHSWGPQHRCWNGGRMDGFVTTHTSPDEEGASNGLLTMGYYTRTDLQFHYALADAFTICDAYHCSVFGPTDPNRCYQMSATIDPSGQSGGPALVTDDSSSAMGRFSWRTMPENLETKGISWKVYNPPGPAYQPTSPVANAVSDNVLLLFKQYLNPSSTLYRKAFLPIYPKDFESDVERGALPQVSWIIDPAVPGLDEHPPAPPVLGERVIHRVLQTLVSNPVVWSKTVLFVTYDENDGFFDHVPPPVPPPGAPGEYVTARPLPAAAEGIDGPIGLGFRVPMLVVSPFSRGGYVCSKAFDHTSQSRFLETRFGVEVPNLSAWRRQAVGDLTAALRFGSFDTSVPVLPATPANPPVLKECQPPQLVEENIKVAPYPLPAVQQMPSQESGTRVRLR